MKSLRHRLLALLLGAFVAIPAAFADDIEIYTNPQLNSLRPPMTILVLDLNLLGICNNVLTNAANPNNPDAPQLCLDLRNNMLLSELLGGASNQPPATLLSSLLTGSGMGAPALCNLYGVLGIASPVVALPAVGILLRPLLGGITNLTCGTLSTLLGIPLLGSVVNSVLPTFTSQLVAGLVSPLLSTVVGQLPATVTGLLQTTIGGVLNLGQVGLIGLLESVLNQLVNSQVAIVVSHADRASFSGARASACAFGDAASIPTTRRETPNCSNGAYFLLGFTPLVDQGSVNQLLTRVSTLLTNALSPANLLNSTTAILGAALSTPTELLPPYQGKEIYAEIAHYLAGDAVYNAPLNRWDGLTGLLTRDTAIESGGSYIQPPAQCDTVNVLNFQLTNNLHDDDSDAALRRHFPSAEASGAFRFVDVVKAAEDPGIVDLAGNKISLRSRFVVQENLSSLSALASVGINATTYANNLGLLGLGQTVAEFLEPVLEVDASLLTPSATADLANPGTLRTDAFFGSFKPAEDQRPRWDGNLKKLEQRLVAADGQFRFFDANNNPAIAADGRIDENALTFWTNPGQLGADAVDGRMAALGGAGQRIPGYQFGGGGNPGRDNAENRRRLFFDRDTPVTLVPTLTALNPDDAAVRTTLQTSLGAASDAETQALLLYARGFEVGTTAQPRTTGLVSRPWLHGAVLHSRPVAINYGARSGYSASNPDVRVVYGSTDGYLRMLSNTSTSGAQSGVESWAFMPRAVMNQQKILRDNAPTPRFPYGVDGAPTVLLQDRSPSGGPADGRIESTNPNDRAWMFFGLRRGGANLYGLNVSNPDAPSLMWRIGADGLFNSSGRVAGSEVQFGEMALTFSNPQAGRIAYTEGATTLTRSVLVFAAGYNGGRDAANARVGKDLARGSDDRLGVDDGRGNALYVIDAETGALVWKARQGAFNASTPFNATTRTFQHPLLVNSIAADTTVVDTDGDGLLDRLYVPDTGGRLWRADFAGTDRRSWSLTPLASVGRHDTANVANDRRFFHAVDYVPFRDASGVYDVLVFGSGDREDPFNYTTENWLYALRDRDVSAGKAVTEILLTENALSDQDDFADLTTLCASGATGCAESADSSTGWRLRLDGAGEKALSQPLSTGGTVFFTSYLPQDPNSTQCEPNEGTNRLYGVSLTDSRPVVESLLLDSDADGDKRSTLGGVAGLPGEINTLTASHIAFNTRTLEARGQRYYPVYWRERRGAEETPP